MPASSMARLQALTIVFAQSLIALGIYISAALLVWHTLYHNITNRFGELPRWAR